MASIVQILPLNGRCILVHGKFISEYSLSSDEHTILYTLPGDAVLTRAAAFSPDGFHLVVCDNQKVIHLLDATTWCVLASSSLEKSAMSVAWARDGASVLVGDKFGDIIRFPVPGTDSWTGQVVAGCVSMVTDLATNAEFIVMADRDEKIRVILEKTPYVIERFLLEHSEYVAAVAWVSSSELVSIGGDRRLVLWNVHASNPIQSVTIPANVASEPFDPLGLVHYPGGLAFALQGQSTVLVVPMTNDRLQVDSMEKIDLPSGFKPVTINKLNEAILVAGLDHHSKPFLVSIQEKVVKVMENLGRLTECLEATSLPWSQLVRSHLRKRRVIEPRQKRRVMVDDDQEESDNDASGSDLE